MKTIITNIFKLIFAILVCLFIASADAFSETRREGNNFISVASSGRADTLVTQFTYEVKGVKYPIIINKASGACYVWKKSGKTGKMYKMYLKDEITNEVCKELNVERKKKSR